MKHTWISLAIGLTVLSSATAFAASAPINLTQNCGKGGTRVVSGTFDVATGAVDLKVTMTDCAGRPGEKLETQTPVGSNPLVPRDASPVSSASDSKSNRVGRPFEAGHATHNGTVAVKGTFKMDTSAMVTVNLVDQIDTKVTFDASANTMTRVCTITRVGTLDARKDHFTGTVTHNNCTMTGDYHENFGLIEHLLRNLTDTSGL
jgi:hypothetical protein